MAGCFWLKVLFFQKKKKKQREDALSKKYRKEKEKKGGEKDNKEDKNETWKHMMGLQGFKQRMHQSGLKQGLEKKYPIPYDIVQVKSENKGQNWTDFNIPKIPFTKKDSRPNLGGTHAEAGSHRAHLNLQYDASTPTLTRQGAKYAAMDAKLFADQEGLSATIINHQDASGIARGKGTTKKTLLQFQGTEKYNDNSIYQDKRGEVACNWKRMKVLNHDGTLTLSADIFFASYDQFAQRVGGHGACSVLSLTIAYHLMLHPMEALTREDFDRLIIRGSQEWQSMRPRHQMTYSGGHFDLETALTAGTCDLKLVRNQSFVGFLSPNKFRCTTQFSVNHSYAHFREYIQEFPSFEDIWSSVILFSHSSPNPVYYIIGWMDHFFMLRVGKKRCYLVETVGRRLSLTCDKAHIIKFCDTASVSGSETGYVTGKSACKIYIENFIFDKFLGDVGCVSGDFSDYTRYFQLEFTCVDLLNNDITEEKGLGRNSLSDPGPKSKEVVGCNYLSDPGPKSVEGLQLSKSLDLGSDGLLDMGSNAKNLCENSCNSCSILPALDYQPKIEDDKVGMHENLDVLQIQLSREQDRAEVFDLFGTGRAQHTIHSVKQPPFANAGISIMSLVACFAFCLFILLGGIGAMRISKGEYAAFRSSHSEWFSSTSLHTLGTQVVPHLFSVKSPSNPNRRPGLVSKTSCIPFLDNCGVIDHFATGLVYRGPRMAAPLLREDAGTGELQFGTAPLKSVNSSMKFHRPKCSSMEAEHIASGLGSNGLLMGQFCQSCIALLNHKKVGIDLCSKYCYDAKGDYGSEIEPSGHASNLRNRSITARLEEQLKQFAEPRTLTLEGRTMSYEGPSMSYPQLNNSHLPTLFGSRFLNESKKVRKKR